MENQNYTNNDSTNQVESQTEQEVVLETIDETNDTKFTKPKKSGVSILVYVVSLILIALITFETTFLITSSINNREKAIINGFISSYYAYLIRMDITI